AVVGTSVSDDQIRELPGARGRVFAHTLEKDRGGRRLIRLLRARSHPKRHPQLLEERLLDVRVLTRREATTIKKLPHLADERCRAMLQLLGELPLACRIDAKPLRRHARVELCELHVSLENALLGSDVALHAAPREGVQSYVGRVIRRKVFRFYAEAGDGALLFSALELELPRAAEAVDRSDEGE